MKLDLQTEVLNSPFMKSLVEDKEIILDNSTFIQIDSCFAQGIMGGLLKKQMTSGSVHLDFGGALHEALEAKYKHKATIAEQVKIAESHDGFHRLDTSHPQKNPDKLRELLTSYHVHTEMTPDFDVLYLGDEPCVELSFRIHLGTITIMASQFPASVTTDQQVDVYWEGKIDVLGVYQHEPWIIDHKTTSIMGEKYVDTFLRSSQMLGYLWAGRQLISEGMHTLTTKDNKVYNLTEKPYRGVLINALCIRKSGPEFKCFPIPIPQTRLEEWRLETLARINFFVYQLSHYLSTGILTPTREHCVTKYGRCPFFDVCEAPVQARKPLLMSPAFVTSEWSPLD